MVTAQDNPKYALQLDLEERMRGLGIERFWKNIEKAREQHAEASTGATKRLLDNAVVSVLDGIKEFLVAAQSGKAGRRHKSVRYLAMIEPETAAYLTVRVVLDSISFREPFQKTALALSNHIEDELRFRQFRKEAPGYAHKVAENLNKTTNHYEHKKKAMDAAIRRKGTAEWQDWPQNERLHLGTKLIELLIERTSLVEKVNRTTGQKTVTFVEATPETLEWIKTENARCEALAPVYLPTIVPPKPWATPFDGGYWSGRVRRLTLVKTANRNYMEELASVEMPEVYASINRMQDTAWAINRPVLEVMAELWTNQSTLACIPSADDLPIPERPYDIPEDMAAADMTEDQLYRFKTWKRDAATVYQFNAKLRSKRLQFVKLLTTAEMFKDEEEFFFPYQLDWRGRVYAVPMFLQPQGNDMARGLLTFANAVPVGDEEGELWLAVHGAGCWGVDKVSLEDRHKWVLDNEAAILASAADPYSNRFWTEAEKPWQALAFCFEWAGYRREGYDFLSSLPVQMDGTCNGLQNFSAMLRDEIGGAAVNLLPSDKPQDIYQRVADIVIRKVSEDAEGGNELAKQWVGRIDRKVTKRPVMTLAYGSREYGFKQQIYDDTLTPMREKGDFPFDKNGWEAADYMGKLIWNSVGEVVVAARHAMDWLQAVAMRAAKEGLPVRWTTPAGFVVQQEYRESTAERVKLTFMGGTMQLALNSDSKNIDKRKQASGISPNWVHSCDAAHMQKTVNKCAELGIASFSLIHDSYGTHAGNAWALAWALRDQFVEMYRGNVLADFKRELEAQLPEEAEALPALPPMGSLDLEKVRDSQFFFA